MVLNMYAFFFLVIFISNLEVESSNLPLLAKKKKKTF